ncbi:MAG: DUF2959 domain-containing protein [Pseudomonadales bacterium]|nr:DUF2959 domain-containing protein [Pseudomonadales bacterium]
MLSFLLQISACETAYIAAMDQIGIHKRDILIDRIESAQEAQQDGREQFQDALEQFQLVLGYADNYNDKASEGSKNAENVIDIKTIYETLKGEYEESVIAADKITERINKVNSVSIALFEEWQNELQEYSSTALKRDSERKLRQTERQFARVMNAMRRAEQSIEPVLATLKDNVLYLKHNLNARAITSLKGEFSRVDNDIKKLLKAMQSAIDESDSFINDLSDGA